MDTASIFVQKKRFGTLNEASDVGKELQPGKNDYGTGVICSPLCWAPKIENNLIFIEYGDLAEKKTFNGFEDVARLMDGKIFDWQIGICVKKRLSFELGKKFQSRFLNQLYLKTWKHSWVFW